MRFRQHSFHSIQGFLSLVVALGLMNPSTTLASAQEAPRQVQRTAPEASPPVRKILDAAEIRVGGLRFPRVDSLPAGAAGKTDGACCQVGDTRQRTDLASIDLETPHGLNRNKYVPPSDYREAVYSPPQTCWVISDYRRVIRGANGPRDVSDDAQPANFSYLTRSEFESIQQEMLEIIAKLDVADNYKGELEAKIEEFIRSYSQYSHSISASHGQIRHRARVQGQGRFRGRSWYRAHINTTETCCPPEVRDSFSMRQTLKTWIDETAAKLPKKGRGYESGIVYPESGIVDQNLHFEPAMRDLAFKADHLQPKNCDCPLQGSRYDGANCFVTRPPRGSKPFVHDGGLYFSPSRSRPGARRCPPGSRFDGRNCFVARAPAGTKPFVYDGALYYTPVCR